MMIRDGEDSEIIEVKYEFQKVENGKWAKKA